MQHQSLVTDVLSIFNNINGWTLNKELKTDQFEAVVYTKKFSKIGNHYKYFKKVYLNPSDNVKINSLK